VGKLLLRENFCLIETWTVLSGTVLARS